MSAHFSPGRLVEMPDPRAPGNRAALASRQAKRVFVVACLLAGWAFESSGGRAGPVDPAALQFARQPGDPRLARVALRLGDSDAVLVGELSYEKNAAESCGEVGGTDRRGAEVRFKDGVRIFVCGPGFHD